MGKILLILNSNPGCHTLSNAWLKSCGCTILLVFHSFIDVCYAVALLHCGVNLSESILMVWDPVLRVQIFIDFFSTSFSNTFEIDTNPKDNKLHHALIRGVPMGRVAYHCGGQGAKSK